LNGNHKLIIRIPHGALMGESIKAVGTRSDIEAKYE
jgi:hypothetical protein